MFEKMFYAIFCALGGVTTVHNTNPILNSEINQ